MSSLGLAHHQNAQNLRISPQGMATLSPQMSAPPNMRLSPPQHHPNGPSLQPPQNLTINIQRQPHSPSSSNSMQLSNTTGPPSGGSGGGGNLPVTPPQNLSMSPSHGMRITPPAGMRIPSSSSPHSLSTTPEKNCKTLGNNEQQSVSASDTGDSTGNNTTCSKESALNMTMNNSDMRSNSIATLRIKAKEHLESINKGLTMV